MLEHLNARIDALSSDSRRGAAEIVEDTVDLFSAICSAAADDPEQGENLFIRAVRRMARGQPSMAPVLNCLNRICLERERCGGDWSCLAGFVKSLQGQRRRRLEAMAGHLNELSVPGGVLAVYSNSSTVGRMVVASHRAGMVRQVICSEARPVNEGLVLARNLTAAGVPVKVFTDAALMSRVQQAGAVWVGGDAISAAGLVNKVGSRALAMLARFTGIPFISLMATDKVLSDELLPYFRLVSHSPREISPDDAEDLDIVNEYYESIPLDLITGVFTEDGMKSVEEATKPAQPTPLSGLFAELMRT